MGIHSLSVVTGNERRYDNDARKDRIDSPTKIFFKRRRFYRGRRAA